MSKIKKIILAIVLFVGVVLIVLYFLPSILSVLFRDGPTIYNSDLQLKKVILADADNMYFDLVQLEKVIKQPTPDSTIDAVSGKTLSDAQITQLLASNSQALRIFEQASHKSKYQDPKLDDPATITPTTEITPMNSWRFVARLEYIKANQLSRQGRDLDAAREALRVLKVGDAIMHSQGSTIQILVGISLQTQGAQSLQSVIRNAKHLTISDLKDLQKNLSTFGDFKEGLVSLYTGEYYIQVQAVRNIVAGDISMLCDGTNCPPLADKKRIQSSFFFQPNNTINLFGDIARKEIAQVDKPCNEVQSPVIKKPSGAIVYTEQNGIGKLLVSVVALSLTSVQDKACLMNVAVNSARTTIALHAYELEKKTIPENLNQLVPVYLSTIPKDAFNGDSLRYNPKKRILYSVGTKGLDVGGSTSVDINKMENPTFSF